MPCPARSSNRLRWIVQAPVEARAFVAAISVRNQTNARLGFSRMLVFVKIDGVDYNVATIDFKERTVS